MRKCHPAHATPPQAPASTALVVQDIKYLALRLVSGGDANHNPAPGGGAEGDPRGDQVPGSKGKLPQLFLLTGMGDGGVDAAKLKAIREGEQAAEQKHTRRMKEGRANNQRRKSLTRDLRVAA